MFEQAFKNIDDVLWKEAGCTTELDYTEQTSWLLFLKYLDGLEQDKAMEAELEGKSYSFILDEPYRWDIWAAPKSADGKLDHNKALTGDDLRDFVDGKLFPYLQGFKLKAIGPNTIEYKIGEIFGEIKNKIHSGYNLREIIDHIDELRFRSQAEKCELSFLYEGKIQRMGNAGRNGGEYYTPRPLIRAIVRVVKPKIGERIYDGAVGSAGFLCEAFDYLKAQGNLTTSDLDTLQTCTFYGKEKKSLAYVIAIMNMILHGIEAPNIIHTNTLAENLADVQEKDRYDVILANPPFGGKERKEVQQNFPIRTGETAFLFLQHFIKMLKVGGRAGVVIKNTFLSNTDNASVSLRKLLLETCDLHTVLDCPIGTFVGATVKTVVLFFDKGAPTRKVWYYSLDPGRNLGKTNPLNDDDLKEFVELQRTFADSTKSWSVDIGTIDQTLFDLSVKNPNGRKVVIHRGVQEILDNIVLLDEECSVALKGVQGATVNDKWKSNKLGDVCLFLNRGVSPKYLDEGGMCVLNQKCIRDHRINYDVSRRHDPLAKPVNRERLIQVGDVLVNSTGTGTLGRVAQVRENPPEPTTVDSHVTIVRPIPGKFYLDYFGYMMIVIEDAIKDAGEGCGGQTELSRSVLADRFTVHYPESLDEQKRIVTVLDEMFNRISIAKVNLIKKNAAIDELKKSLLQQAFGNN